MNSGTQRTQRTQRAKRAERAKRRKGQTTGANRQGGGPQKETIGWEEVIYQKKGSCLKRASSEKVTEA